MERPNDKCELLVDATIHFEKSFSLPPLQVTTLSDIGCQIMAVGGRQLFPQSVVEKAPRAVRLVGAGRTPIPGGDKGVTFTMDIPIMGKRGPVLFRCHNVFIYLADIGNRVLLGFPFFSQYTLAFIPSVELLVPVEDCWCFRGGHKKRCVKCQFIEAHCVCASAQKATLQQVVLGFPTSPILRRSGHPSKQHSVHFRNPVVSAAWCLLCFPLLPPASGQSCHHVTAISGYNNESESKGDRPSEIRLTERIRPVLWYDPNPFNSRHLPKETPWKTVGTASADDWLQQLPVGAINLLRGDRLSEIPLPVNFTMVNRLSSTACMPERGTEHAAGFDLRSPRDFVVPAKSQILVPLDIAVAIPVDAYAQIASRSGFAVRKRLHVRAGVIDADYRGNLQVLLENTGDESQSVSAGDRFAQLIVLPVHNALPAKEFAELPPSVRGDHGFGSTGVHAIAPAVEKK